MKVLTRSFIGVFVFAVCFFVLPRASADDWDKETVVTFSVPVEVPGVGAQVLPAGTYVFKIMKSDIDSRHIVQIFNEDKSHVFTTILAIPNYRFQATDQTVMTFKERAQGQPEAIRAWFYPGQKWGQEFVYPKSKAIELAKTVNQPVLSTAVEVTSIEDLKTAPIEAVKPTGEAVPMAEVVQSPPVEVAKLEPAAALPQTASYLPLMACIGLFSLVAAGIAAKYSA